MDARGQPPPAVIASGEGWFSAKLTSELDLLLNLIYLAQREPSQYRKYLSLAEETIGRIRLMSQESHSPKHPGSET